MAANKKRCDKKGQEGVTWLISFLAGAAVGVGLVFFAESKTSSKNESTYGEADLFV